MNKMINISNQQRMIDFIQEKQSAYSSRKLNMKDIADLISRAESKLHHLPKATWKGIKLKLGYHHSKPNSYAYTMEASFVYIERRASNWFITDLLREPTGYRDKEEVAITIPMALKDEFISRWLIKNEINFEQE